MKQKTNKQTKQKTNKGECEQAKICFLENLPKLNNPSLGLLKIKRKSTNCHFQNEKINSTEFMDKS